jgi:hypothetical protein
MQPNALLQSACDQHGFDLAVLTDMDGFALAYAKSSLVQMESMAATGALAWRLVQRMQEHVGLGAVNEFTLSHGRGQKLICHLFEAKTQILMVVVLLPLNSVAYKRAIKRLIHQLKEIL